MEINSKTLNDVNNDLIIFSNNLFERAFPYLNSLNNVIRNISQKLYPVLTDLKKVFTSQSVIEFLKCLYILKYIDSLDNTKWPRFDYSNSEFKTEIFLLSYNNNQEGKSAFLCNYYEDVFLEKIYDNWGPYLVDEDIKTQVKLIEHDLKLHNNGVYDCHVSNIVNRIMGLISVIYERHKQIQILNVERLKRIYPDYKHLKYNKFGKPLYEKGNEKYKLIHLFFISSFNVEFCRLFIDYMTKVFFTSEENIDLMEHHPLRNKICHGKQLNYGTKEHYLRVIFIFDVLIKLNYNLKNNIKSEIQYLDSSVMKQ